ncbi:MAG TPA: PQQ-dependent sugar dehydrogenase [Erythrobacter sp.]|nr:PQQ-dependent sugar dehydrogenase [Erythrobacter sp.]
MPKLPAVVTLSAIASLLAVPGAAQQADDRQAITGVSSEAGELQLQVVASGLDHPWAVAPLPDGRFLVTERNPGQIRLVGTDGSVSEPLGNVPEVFRFEGKTGRSQAGLFDIVLHPEFASNNQIFVSFSKPTERGAGVAIIRARLDGNGLDDVEEIFVMNPEDQDSSGLHFGGRMAIAADRQHLLLSIGDRRNISRAQDFADQAGSILRMTLDGQPAADNPQFPAEEGEPNDEAKPADPYLFAVGSRHSQALAIAPGSGDLWSAEHGPQGGDRVDRITPGVNLGWPFYTAGKDYSDAPIGASEPPAGMQAPTHAFGETVAPSGATFYTANTLTGWSNALLVGGLGNKALMRIAVNGASVGSVETIDIGHRVRDVRVGPDGAVWMVTDEKDGKLLRLAPAETNSLARN